MARRWDFVLPRSSEPYSLFGVRASRRRVSRPFCRRETDFDAATGRRRYSTDRKIHGGTSKQRPEYSNQRAECQRRSKNELPKTGAFGCGKIAMKICAAAINQTKAVRVVIKNQDAPYFAAYRICYGQPPNLFDDENLSLADSALSARKRGSDRIRLTIIGRPNERRRERR
ncbi:MAG: hypothetical protein JWO45_1867 [Spartobacteria bacterium]|nr:hypothetical protein [Spartobacteria bacterium]